MRRLPRAEIREGAAAAVMSGQENGRPVWCLWQKLAYKIVWGLGGKGGDLPMAAEKEKVCPIKEFRTWAKKGVICT